ncbi:hypothetical protein AFAEC_0852 [Aliarcobacter faecis]|uniref:hypothetical protein n=1 Tax=Aliarcobacter faecis TaxID=1564138 RepID=UPI00047E0250|nr:hypothetical protein [Aliarcobacter faecis]QKF73027.1 hypothetical protein AFAEC_0852 [Aliarcobacter faecis]
MAKSDSNNLGAIDNSLHILVLVAGTTDPINATTSTSSRAISYGTSSQDMALQKDRSYTQIPVNYWDKRFKIDIEAFDKKYVNLVLFPFHGWTGDNSIENREIAGQYLVNRLCGANGEKPYYEKTWQNKEITFHLLGHSHGGNVVNEMTKQISRLGSKWPEKWKIKSLIYLSTPFFKKIHQVKVDKSFFHDEAEVFHMFNKYDLTQRMLADFSLESLAEALENLGTKELKDAIENTVKLANEIPFGNLKEFHFEYAGARFMSHENGLALYQSTINFFKMLDDKGTNGLIKIFEELIVLCDKLNQDYTFDNIESKIKGNSQTKPINQRKILSDANHQRLTNIFKLLISDINIVISTLTRTLNRKIEGGSSSKFDKADYFSDLFSLDSFVNHLIDLLDINSKFLISYNPSLSLWDSLYLVLQDNIKMFDNTYVNPDIQFKGTFLESKISYKDVTKDDLYNSAFNSKNYDRFINRIENIENRFETSPSKTNLLDLLFTLLANDKAIYTLIKELASWNKWINIGEVAVTGKLDTNLKRVRNLFSNLEKIFDDRHFDLLDSSHKLSKEQIQNNSDDNPYNDTLQRGSLMYFLVESHSTSRRYMHKELKEFLEKVGTNR